MPRSSEILGPPLHQPDGDHGDIAAEPGVYRADVLAVASNLATVTIPAYSERADWAGVPIPQSATVVAGDRVWVSFDDERQPVIVLVPA